MSWKMPAETAPQDRVWMAFPVANESFEVMSEDAQIARGAWSAVANAIVQFEPVTMVVDPSERNHATKFLSSDVELIEAPLDDCWMRDMGPTFVLDENGSLGAIDWIFQGWGAQDWSSWNKDAQIASFVADAAGVPALSSLLVNEGGALHVDGLGTVIITETVQLDRDRNPYADKARVEAELARTLGASHVVWLPRGLTRDYEKYGTRGHVDMIAAIPSPGTLLLHAQPNPSHPDHEVMKAVRRHLESTTDAAGRPWTIIDLPAPDVLTDDVGFVDYNYVNHLVVNGGVIACGFGEPVADARARAILADAYPGRDVVTIDARPIFDVGGGIHCITQQQPSAITR